MRSYLGDQHYETISKIVDEAHPNAKATWQKFESELKVVDSKHRGRGAYYSPAEGGITFNLKNDSAGDNKRKPFEVLFHEFGHNIDHLSARKAGFGQYENFSNRYKDGLFPKTIKEEVQSFVNQEFKQFKESFNKAENKDEWFDQHKEYFGSIYGVELYKKNPQLFKPSINHVYSAIGRRLTNLPLDEQAAISDIFNGATTGKIKASWKHPTAHWKRPGTVAAEAFANLFSSTVSNKQAYDKIKERLPKTVEVFEEMLAEISR